MESEPQGTTSETDTQDQPETGASSSPETGTDGRRDDAAYWKAQADKQERRAKANADAAKELDKLRRQSMTDQERAAAEAADKATAEVTARLGGRLVKAEMRAAAGGRLSAEQVDALAARLDMASFLTSEGDVDVEAVAEFVNALALPSPVNGETPVPFPDFGQGARGAPPAALNGDPLMNDLKNKLGLR